MTPNSRHAPYRADHVGSLLRPAMVQAARERYLTGTVGPDGFGASDDLRAVEDQAIRDVVAMQESIGLPAVTDGEYRRSFWHYDFMGSLEGMNLVERDQGVQFQGAPGFQILEHGGLVRTHSHRAVDTFVDAHGKAHA